MRPKPGRVAGGKWPGVASVSTCVESRPKRSTDRESSALNLTGNPNPPCDLENKIRTKITSKNPLTSFNSVAAAWDGWPIAASATLAPRPSPPIIDHRSLITDQRSLITAPWPVRYLLSVGRDGALRRPRRVQQRNDSLKVAPTL